MSTTLVLDLVVGAVMNHVMSTPANLHERMVEQAESFIEQLVDFVLLGIHAAEASRASQSPGEARVLPRQAAPRPQEGPVREPGPRSRGEQTQGPPGPAPRGMNPNAPRTPG